MKTKFPRYKGKESDLQEACVRWFRLQHPDVLAFHVPNETRRQGRSGDIERMINKKQGVLSGVSDILIFHPHAKGCGLAVELKVSGGRVSENQKSFLERIACAGWCVAVCWSIEDFMDVVNEYMTED